MGAERERVAAFGRMEDGLKQSGPWYSGGPTSASGSGARSARTTARTATRGTTCRIDHARSRAYRWGEDGLAGFCDIEQQLCLGPGAVERAGPFLKERLVRADRAAGQPRRGRQGALVVPRRGAQPRLEPLALPLPAGRVPLRPAAAPRTRAGPARPRSTRSSTPGSSTRTGTGSPRSSTPRATTRPTCWSTIRVTNAGPDADTIHVLPTAWFRNTWSWDGRRAASRQWPGSDGTASAVDIEHPFLGDARAARGTRRRRHRPTRTAAVLRERDQLRRGCSTAPPATPYPKDGINDHVVGGAATVNPEQHRAPSARSGTS